MINSTKIFKSGGVQAARALLAAWMLLALLCLAAPAIGQAGHGSNFTDVDHEPDIPMPDDDVVVTATVADTGNITNVRFIFCTLEPYHCYLPAYTNVSENGTFTGTFTEYLDNGTRVGYNVTIFYADGGTEQAPTGPAGKQFDKHVVEPLAEHFYFLFVVGEEATVDGDGDGNGNDGGDGGIPGFEAVAAIGVLAAVAVAIARKRK